ncbi:hypothetical protein [Nisaea sp.]|uniref:hypothetical protein n=1 Tax=Nisaea sp. TaxID=2024842 RepID=UPI003B51574A
MEAIADLLMLDQFVDGPDALRDCRDASFSDFTVSDRNAAPANMEQAAWGTMFLPRTRGGFLAPEAMAGGFEPAPSPDHETLRRSPGG